MTADKAVFQLKQHFAGHVNLDVEEFEGLVGDALRIPTRVPPDLKKRLFRALCNLKDHAEKVENKSRMNWCNSMLERVGG
jgi:hypothetical protein